MLHRQRVFFRAWVGRYRIVHARLVKRRHIAAAESHRYRRPFTQWRAAVARLRLMRGVLQRWQRYLLRCENQRLVTLWSLEHIWVRAWLTWRKLMAARVRGRYARLRRVLLAWWTYVAEFEAYRSSLLVRRNRFVTVMKRTNDLETRLLVKFYSQWKRAAFIDLMHERAAGRFRTHRLLAISMASWVRFIELRHAKLERASLAQRMNHLRIQSRHIQQWARISRESAQQRRTRELQMHKHRFGNLQWSFGAWRLFAIKRIRGLQQRCFTRWVRYKLIITNGRSVEQSRQLRLAAEHLRKWKVRHQHSRGFLAEYYAARFMKHILHDWYMRSHWERAHAEGRRWVTEALAKHSDGDFFLKDSAEDHELMRQVFLSRKAASYYRKHVGYTFLMAWRRYARDVSRAGVKLRYALYGPRSVMHSSIVSAWREWAVQRGLDRVLWSARALPVLRRIQYRRKMQVFAVWRLYAKAVAMEAQRRRQTASNMHERTIRRTKRTVLTEWRRVLILMYTVEQRAVVRVGLLGRNAFMAWYGFVLAESNARVRTEQIDRFRRQHILAESFFKWGTMVRARALYSPPGGDSGDVDTSSPPRLGVVPAEVVQRRLASVQRPTSTPVFLAAQRLSKATDDSASPRGRARTLFGDASIMGDGVDLRSSDRQLTESRAQISASETAFVMSSATSSVPRLRKAAAGHGTVPATPRSSYHSRQRNSDYAESDAASRATGLPAWPRTPAALNQPSTLTDHAIAALPGFRGTRSTSTAGGFTPRSRERSRATKRSPLLATALEGTSLHFAARRSVTAKSSPLTVAALTSTPHRSRRRTITPSLSPAPRERDGHMFSFTSEDICLSEAAQAGIEGMCTPPRVLF